VIFREGDMRIRRSAGPLRAAVGIAGELFLTLGALMLLYVAWQLWWTNLDAQAVQRDAVGALSQQFGGPVEPSGQGNFGPPLVAGPPADGETFGIVYIPRFAKDFSVPVSAGVGPEILDALGLGMYPGTVMPGEVGNFAVAGHRQTYGKVLDQIDTLQPGDRIHVRTADGYYSYVFEEHNIVTPDRTDVLLPVPERPGAEPVRRIMTLTTCHPRYGDQERYIAYAVLESWRPTEAGPPAEIADVVAAQTGA
jgi:sortase A